MFHVKRSSLAREREAPLSAENSVAAVPPLALSRLRSFAALLLRWNPTIRLIGSRDSDDLWQRHIADALQLMPLIPHHTQAALDLGSGGGLPGLVLAIATGIPFDLIESDGRKAAFLREAAIATQAPVTIHAQRIEDIILPPRPLLTARALAPLPKLLALAHPFLTEDGVCLFPKGEKAEVEIAEAEQFWTMTVERLPSSTAKGARLLRISGLKPKGPTP